MKADRVEVSKNESDKQWLIRIQVGGEVIRRHSNEPKDASQDTLRDIAVKVAADEGYEVEPSAVVFS